MISKAQLAYIKTWQKSHQFRVRQARLKYYHKNARIIWMVLGKAKSGESDEADEWYAERNPDG